MEARLRGDEAGIKAYSIAVDVFGRPSDFDPQADPIVRVQARRLRGLLQEFYRQNLAHSGVRITLPVGRYVPEFETIGAESAQDATQGALPGAAAEAVSSSGAEESSRRFGRRFWLQAGAAAALVLALGLLLVALQVFRAAPSQVDLPGMPQEPRVYMSAFSNLTRNPALDNFAARLDDKLGSVLAQFEDVEVRFAEPGQALQKMEGVYLLSGAVNTAASGVEVTAVLTDVGTGAAIWNRSLTQPTPSADDEAIVSNVARKIMREIGPFRGPIHAAGRKWLDKSSPQIPAVNGYVCLLTFRYARESSSPAAIAKSLDCHDRLLSQEPDQPLALAAKAWLEARVIFVNANEGDRLDIGLADAVALAERARVLAPRSSFVLEQLANIQSWQQNYALAQRNYAIALGFEPLNTDARASYAITLGRTGDWTTAVQQAQFAIADAAFPSPWYFYLPAISALRDGRLDQAIKNGRSTAASGEIGNVVALAAAGLAKDTTTIGELRPLVMSMESLRRGGIMPWVRIRIKDEGLLERISTGLRAAGIPELALTAQF